MNSQISRVFIASFPTNLTLLLGQSQGESVKCAEIYANNNVGKVFAFKLKQYKL